MLERLYYFEKVTFERRAGKLRGTHYFHQIQSEKPAWSEASIFWKYSQRAANILFDQPKTTDDNSQRAKLGEVSPKVDGGIWIPELLGSPLL